MQRKNILLFELSITSSQVFLTDYLVWKEKQLMNISSKSMLIASKGYMGCINIPTSSKTEAGICAQLKIITNYEKDLRDKLHFTDTEAMILNDFCMVTYKFGDSAIK